MEDLGYTLEEVKKADNQEYGEAYTSNQVRLVGALTRTSHSESPRTVRATNRTLDGSIF